MKGFAVLWQAKGKPGLQVLQTEPEAISIARNASGIVCLHQLPSGSARVFRDGVELDGSDAASAWLEFDEAVAQSEGELEQPDDDLVVQEALDGQADYGPVREDLRLHTVADVAEALQVDERTVRRYMEYGLIGHRRLGGSVRFTEEDLRRFYEESYQPPID